MFAGVILALLAKPPYKAFDVADPLFDGDAVTTKGPTRAGDLSLVTPSAPA